MASSGANSIAIDECMDLDFVGEIAQQQRIGFIGNLHVTATLFEEAEDIVAEVERCLDVGQRFPGYVFGLGSPLTQHIRITRLEEAIAAYRAQQR